MSLNFVNEHPRRKLRCKPTHRQRCCKMAAWCPPPEKHVPVIRCDCITLQTPRGNKFKSCLLWSIRSRRACLAEIGYLCSGAGMGFLVGVSGRQITRSWRLGIHDSTHGLPDRSHLNCKLMFGKEPNVPPQQGSINPRSGDSQLISCCSHKADCCSGCRPHQGDLPAEGGPSRHTCW